MACLLLYDEDERVLHLAHLCLGVGDEVGGDVAAVKLHPLHHLDLVVQRLAVLLRFSPQEKKKAAIRTIGTPRHRMAVKSNRNGRKSNRKHRRPHPSAIRNTPPTAEYRRQTNTPAFSC